MDEIAKSCRRARPVGSTNTLSIAGVQEGVVGGSSLHPRCCETWLVSRYGTKEAAGQIKTDLDLSLNVSIWLVDLEGGSQGEREQRERPQHPFAGGLNWR